MSSAIIYKLSNIPGFNEFVKTGVINDQCNNYYSVQIYSTKANEHYSIVNYNKDILSSITIPIYGLLRSVIVSGENIVCFSPPKSISGENFITNYPIKTNYIIAYEFIEGTMINVFYDPTYGANGCWQISTRNTVGGEIAVYRWSTKTINEMFMEACIENKINIQTLNPRFCYSFVLQHPDNKIVTPFKNIRLYLVSVFEIIQMIDNITVIEENLNNVRNHGLWNMTGVRFPEIYEFITYTELIDKFSSPNTPYNIPGIVVKNTETGERTKFRNPIYEEVRHQRYNQPKLQYRYLCLRHAGKLPEFFKHYPETKGNMVKIRAQVHMFTSTLHQNYISCFVKKEKTLNQYTEQYRNHMLKLHEYFINELRPNKLCISNIVVNKYVNNLHPSLLMYCLNHNLRKRAADDSYITN